MFVNQKAKSARMQIYSFWFRELPSQLPQGTYIVIDVWGATTNLSIMLAKKPKRLFITNKQQLPQVFVALPEAVPVGDSLDPSIKFKISNAPHEVLAADLEGKVIAYTSINGTKVLEALKGKGLAIGCAFNNVSAVAEFLKTQNQDIVIIMAGEPQQKTSEDKIGGDVLIAEVTQQTYNWPALQHQVSKIIEAYEGPLWAEKAPGVEVLLRQDEYHLIPSIRHSPEDFLEIYDLLSAHP